MPRTVKRDKNLRAGQPAKPDELTGRAGEEWDRLTLELDESNIQLTPAHRSTLAQAAQLCADMEEARARIATDGAYILGKVGLVAHPATKRLDALRRDYIKVLTMLGLRAAVASDTDEKEASLSDLLGAGRK